jgi:CDGSH-type Zn-finger protein
MGQGFAVITSDRSDYLRALYGNELYWFCRCETAAVWRSAAILDMNASRMQNIRLAFMLLRCGSGFRKPYAFVEAISLPRFHGAERKSWRSRTQ